MKTPIDFGKEFLHTFFDQRDADACQGMLAGDLVWITPENMHHFLSEGAVLSFLRKKIEEDGESRYVDLVSIKSSPSADNIMTVAYEINLVSREEDKPLHLRCSMAICRRGRRLEITFLHFSKKSERDGSEQLREFVMNLPCGVMILACLDGRREEAIFYNEYFARKLRYREDEFARAVSRNPFFMTSEEDRERIHSQIGQAREKGGSLAVNLRVYRKDGNSFYYRMTGSPVFQADGGTVFYCIFQETTGFQLTAARLQGRLDSVTEILRQVPEGICVIEYPPQDTDEKNPSASGEADRGPDGEKKELSDDSDVKVYRKGKKKDAAKSRTYASGSAAPVLAETVGPVSFAKASDTTSDTINLNPSKDSDTVSLSPLNGTKKGQAEGDPEQLPGKEQGSPDNGASRRGKEKKKSSRVFYLSRNLPAMFGVSNSAFTRNILQDPFYGLEMTSITRDRLLSSPIFQPEKAGAGRAVSCGIFRMRRPDGKSLRLELAARKIKSAEGATRLFLFYFDREEQQQDTENRIDRAMKMGRAGQDQLREELRKAREASARRESELAAAAKVAGEKYQQEIARIEGQLVEEKNRSAIMARRLDKNGVEKTRLKEDLKKARTDASMRIRGLQSEMERRVKEAEKSLAAAQEEAAVKIEEAQRYSSAEMEKAEQRAKDAEAARRILEEQLREAQERNRLLQDQLQEEKTRRLLLEERSGKEETFGKEKGSGREEGSGKERGFRKEETQGIPRMADHTPADIPAAGDWMTENDPLTVFSTIGLDTDSPVRSSGSFDQAVLIPGSIPRGSGRGAGAAAAVYGSAMLAAPRQIFQTQEAEKDQAQQIPQTHPAAPELMTAEERDLYTEKRIRVRESDKAKHRLRRLMNRASSYVRTPQEAKEIRASREDTKYGYQIRCGRENIGLLMEDFLDAASEFSLLREQVFSPESFLQNIMIYEGMACAEKGIFLRLNLESRLPDSVAGFRGLFQRALCGLVENSIAHTERGGRIAVLVRADRPSEGRVNLHIRVEDNGEGIPADRMQTIFEAEKSPENDNVVRSGLFAAREAAALMGGSIHARSREGSTRFLLTVSLRVHQ
ncbi:MAG: PAS domain-containing protein [Sarcina sp.]|nr:PAS domain-containing protein [Sarcina sp.]